MWAVCVTTAPPREWPIRMMGGGVGRLSLGSVWVRMWTRSALRVSSDRSGVPWEEVVVLPWPRASRERTPAFGRIFWIAVVKTANERPEEPAPWWVTKRGPSSSGGAR